MKKLVLLLACFLTILTFELQAQQHLLGVQFNYMQPLHEYGRNLEAHHPKGLGMNFLFKPALFNKFYVGAQIGVSMYAMDSYNESVWVEDEFKDIEIEEEDCFFSYSLVGRYYLVEDKLINPYVEAKFGGLSFFSTKMTEDDYDEYYDNSTIFYGSTIQLGLGAGLSYHVGDNLWIDLNIVYNRGGKTDYRNIGSTDIEYRLNPSDSKFVSYTDNVNYSLGVQFSF